MEESSGEHLGAVWEASVWESFGWLEAKETSGRHLEVRSQKSQHLSVKMQKFHLNFTRRF
jgi:hypothetical protein